MTDLRKLLLTLGAALVLAALLANTSFAADGRAILFLQARASARPELGYVLEARLVTTDNKPVNESAVVFYDVVDLFGSREMQVGAATTDGQGLAAVTYLPARAGTHRIVARSVARPGLAASEGRASLEASVTAASYVVEPAPLSAFSSKVPYGAGAIVLAVWALIAFALFGTARGVMTGARKEGKGDTA